MKNGTKIIFLREKVIHSKSVEVNPHEIILEEIPAVYIAESGERCSICHEEDRNNHSRGGRRKHGFSVETFSTIEVHYPNEPVEVRHHVQMGDAANCYKEL